MIIVALCLIVIFGMVALTVDVGAMLVMRRRLVTAADAASLAAAQSCGKKEGILGANAEAALLTTSNVPTASLATPPVYEPSCDAAAGRVTVTVTAPQALAFAPVIGGGTSRDVTATATAIWGGVGGGNFVPFMLSEGRLLSCSIPFDVQPGDTCTFWMNNKEGLGSSQWAMLNLNTVDNFSRWGWNVARDYGGCVPANTAETLDWINNGSPMLSLNYPAPTFVCVDTGATPPAFNALAALAGQIRLFPINDAYGWTDGDLLAMNPPDPNAPYPHGQVNKTGQPCPPSCDPGGLGPIDKYDIVGFAKLRIISVERGNNGGQVTCFDPDTGLPRPKDPNAWCLKVEWVGYYTDVGSIGDGDNFGLIHVRLIK